ncbi:MAG: hypothetical protein COZ46_07620 [Verrucomicrobia bacterium CG_4_10_14_3_um_filter_43_23]|nr:MAG: hypothetical protein AUJ82_03265 [Verrucomicrobia bacterium CG1_02_43_26]PIP59715.1 MAG: hypothetical protein COX01_02095 [Verrucomicrobia bacterium CG22_combo_CG10-13_8_21_14_all_43_17]PIX57727.1 MAG: hypothetical protein COZ46_07620 [Verrucomicrobia bacterium CG_4_10_14_3_um_filter_43_23]PIY62519.1 MAG: hypothetical protein COY94_01805 [Verrucomicrobia bacterium CG_4_10_14_0_8_um_filter_43_34]PJA44661.1 MAG: hypothetical protein CO175_01820 [Verrucomicrobia bacterium CG_4_9_14_3_um_fi
MKTTINGLCKITYKGETFYAVKGVSIITECVYSTINTSVQGVQRVCRNLVTEVSFIPVFEWTDKRFDTLFPYFSNCCGKSIFQSFSGELVIETISGDVVTFSRAAVSRMPSLEWGSDRVFGELSLRSLGAPVSSRSTAYGFKNIKPKEKISLASGPFQVSWGNESLSSAIAAEIAFSLDLEKVFSDESGVVDYVIKEMSSQIKLDHYYDRDAAFAERHYRPGQSLMSLARPIRLESTNLACIIEDVFLAKRKETCASGRRVQTLHESLCDSSKRTFKLTQN